MSKKIDEFYEILKKDRIISPWSASDSFKTRFDEFSEEIKEIGEALDNNDMENLKEELGDALWDLMFLAILADEKNSFNFEDVVQSALDKIKRRKPWIFNNEKITLDEEKKRWQKIKKEEKSKISSKQ